MIKKDIAKLPGGENVMNCFLCGTCTAGCPVSKIDSAYSPRTIMRMALYGMDEELLSLPEIWKCTQCHVCVAHCPQNARPADVIKVVRQLAVERGYFSADTAAKIDEVEEEMKKLRLEKIGALLNKEG